VTETISAAPGRVNGVCRMSLAAARLSAAQIGGGLMVIAGIGLVHRSRRAA
jgi:hypothetical protein